jgi:hypothetical protein
MTLRIEGAMALLHREEPRSTGHVRPLSSPEVNRLELVRRTEVLLNG